MNTKDTLILLTFLLCILGLIIGVQYSETNEPTLKTNNTKEVVHQDSNKTITTEPNQENNMNIFEELYKLMPINLLFR